MKGGFHLISKWLGPIGIGLFLFCLGSGVRAEEIFSSLLQLFSVNQPQVEDKESQADRPTSDLYLEKMKIASPEQKLPNHTIFGLHIGQTTKEVVRLLGQPQRKDLSYLGYEWWIYNQNGKRYVQVGVQEGRVLDLYSHTPVWDLDGMKASRTKLSGTDKINFQYEGAAFTVSNSHTDRSITLVQDIPVIIYRDTLDGNKATGIRMMTKELLLKSKSYDLEWTYSEKAPQIDAPELTMEQIKKVQYGNERQSLDLANVARQHFGLPMLDWNEKASAVARGHSQDMRTHQFFDHVSATTGDNPFDRMKKAGIRYRAAGENIAMGYADPIEAHHGWMNSPGHRTNILNKDFTTLGVGWVEAYATQNFVTP